MPVMSGRFSLRASSISCGIDHPLQFGDVDVALLDRLIMLVNDVAFAGVDLFGNFLGQRQRLSFGLQLRFDFVQRGLRIVIGRFHIAEGVRTAVVATGVCCFRFRHDENRG